MKLDEYIESCTDYNELTATKMAEDCQVSPATISRYVQKIGYENFSHLRYNLIEKDLIENNLKQTNDLILRKIDYVDYCLSEFKGFDFQNLKILNTKKVLVYSEPRFDLVTKIFIEKMNLTHNNYCLVRSISEFEYITNSMDGDCSVLSIGTIPRPLYNKEYNYLEIKYKNDNEKNEKKENIYEINILNKKHGRKENKIIDNLLPIMITLDVISEEYTKIIKSSREIENIQKYLL